ncbi:MAG: cupredoxin domain-containing protein [Alphaproteobacteria bacterium]
MAMRFFVFVFCAFFSISAHAEKPVFQIDIQNHKFHPAQVTIPAGQKVKLIVSNKDVTAEEFESYDFNREKIISGNSKATIFVGPLEPGTYKFFGEFNPKTAQGLLIVK